MEGTGKSMNALYVGNSRAEVTSNSEKIKYVALAIVELHWSGRQAGRQAMRTYVYLQLEEWTIQFLH